MGERIALNGAWQFKDYIGQDWVWRDAVKPRTRDVRHWRTGTVPGTLQNDVWQNGEVPKPYFERNSLLIEWVPERTWIYKRTFFVSEEHRGKRIQLCFEGVDYEAQFFLNGTLLGAHRGMYTPAVFDVSDAIAYDRENLVAVVIEPAPQEQPQVGQTFLVRTHKSRMTYWWDFCPRMVHVGIWDGVYLDVTDQARIEDVFVRPRLTEHHNRAETAVTVRMDSARAAQVQIEATIEYESDVVARGEAAYALTVGENTVEMSLMVPQPELWYPNEYGAQALYTLKLRVLNGGTESDARTVTFGIREVQAVANEKAEADALPYTFVVNSRKVYINGWNWVPLDVMYGVERPEKLEHLLELARRAHVNMLRVWGGGLIEKEAFYNLCDKHGIMVWQEFIQSSSGIDNLPAEDAAFLEMMKREAEQIVPRKRNHPSLVVWSGGNELQVGEERPADDSTPVLRALHNVVARLDPDRLWYPTSPTGRVFSNSLENIERDPAALHDVHGPWEFQGVTGQATLYNATTSLFHSEFGAEGLTNRKTLDTVLAPEHQFPVTLENPYWFHLGAWWVKEPMWRETFGELPDISAVIRATQFLQAEGVRYAIEANRRRMYQNSGSLPWQLNEPYPMAACTSAVDYYGTPKPLYYAVARAYAPLSATAKFATMAWEDQARFAAELWVTNAHPFAVEGILTARLVGADGNGYLTMTMSAYVGANCATHIEDLDAEPGEILQDVFFLNIELNDDMGNMLAQNRYTFCRTKNLAPLLALPWTQLQTTTWHDGDAWRIAIGNVGEHAALGVQLEDGRECGAEGFVYFDDNYFSLLPGETRTVRAEWRGVPVRERQIVIPGWNCKASC